MEDAPMNSPALLVVTVCPKCGSESTTDYVLLGTPTKCGDCAENVVQAVRPGTAYPLTGTHITYGAFFDLLSHVDSQSILSKLLQQWFGLLVVGRGPDTHVKSADNTSMDLLDLHRRIQDNELQRGELYNVAMTIWHS